MSQINCCCLCGREIKPTDISTMVPVNHETGEFVRQNSPEIESDAVSLFDIGPECFKKWAAEFDENANLGS